MKKIFRNTNIFSSTGLLFILAIFLASCSGTKITGAWKNSKEPGKTYSSIFVASLSSNTVARATVENAISLALTKHGIATYKSIDEFPPGVKKDSVTKEDILGRMRTKKADAIFTVSLVRKETESRYVPGAGVPYAPVPLYPHYSDFGGYYSFWNPYTYNPGYYEQEKTYYIETNLYDSATSNWFGLHNRARIIQQICKVFQRSSAKPLLRSLKKMGC